MNIEQLREKLVEIGFGTSEISGPMWCMAKEGFEVATWEKRSGLLFYSPYQMVCLAPNPGEAEAAFVGRFLNTLVFGSATVADVLGITQDRINNTITKLQGIDPRKQLREDVCDDIEAALTTLTGI